MGGRSRPPIYSFPSSNNNNNNNSNSSTFFIFFFSYLYSLLCVLDQLKNVGFSEGHTLPSAVLFQKQKTKFDVFYYYKWTLIVISLAIRWTDGSRRRHRHLVVAPLKCCLRQTFLQLYIKPSGGTVTVALNISPVTREDKNKQNHNDDDEFYKKRNKNTTFPMVVLLSFICFL